MEEEKLIAELLAEGCERTEFKRSGKVQVYYELDGVLLGRSCSRCEIVQRREGFHARKSSRGGIRPICKKCETKRYSKYHANTDPENAEIRRGQMREATSKWKKDNPEKNRNQSSRRRAMVAGLVNDLTDEQYTMITDHFNDSCALTGVPISSGNVHMEHFLAISTGHGGTTIGNCYPMLDTLNLSKWANNPFEWYIENAKRFNISPIKWNQLISYLADLNGMDVMEFREYVYNVYEMEQRHTPTWTE